MPPAPLPHPVVLMEAQRAMRQHHMLWHTSRDGWNRFPPDVRQAYTQLGWEPPRPSKDAQGQPIVDNDSGEDFLYMHHQMIIEVNRKLAELNDAQYPKVEGWASFPAPGDQDYPVPPTYLLGSPDDDAWLGNVKSDDYFRETFQPREKQFEEPAYLKTISLGELGARVEFTVHNWAHMRWSAQPRELRPDPDPSAPQAVDAKWDDPSYDWLGDFYSSHVNPHFWKLHGWVDDRIEAWKTANGITGEYQWKGTWSGKMDMGGHHGMHDMLSEAVETGEPSDVLSAHVEETDELLRAAAVVGRIASPLNRVEL